MSTLFQEFEAVSKAQWIEKLKQDLKAKPFESLVKSYSFGELQPIYHKEDQAKTQYLKSMHHALLNEDMPGMGARYWSNVAQISVADEKEANKKALELLNSGADELLFDLSELSSVDFAILLKDIELPYCQVSFNFQLHQRAYFTQFTDYVKSKSYAVEKIKGKLYLDPLALMESEQETDLDQLAELVNQNVLPNYYSFCVDARLYHNAGAHIEHEVAFALSKYLYYINYFSDKGIDANRIIRNVFFSLSIGKKYFPAIAKLLALRWIALKLVEEMGLELRADELYIATESSLWDSTLFDPYTNLLRNTTQAMSAVLGGAQSVYIHPYNVHYRERTAFSERIARNISLMLKEESYFHHIADSTAGSYAIEHLTDQIIDSAFGELKILEEKGGYIEALKSGYIVESIQKDKESQLQEVARRKEVYIGSNMFSNASESLDIKNVAFFKTGKEDYLYPSHATCVFDNLRLRTEKHVLSGSKRPQAILISLQTDAISKARVNFAHSFLAAAGINVLDELIIRNQQFDVLQEHQQADYVVLCATDEYYENECAKDVTTILNHATTGHLILAGLPSNHATLAELGVKMFIHRNSDTLGQLSELQNWVGVK